MRHTAARSGSTMPYTGVCRPRKGHPAGVSSAAVHLHTRVPTGRGRTCRAQLGHEPGIMPFQLAWVVGSLGTLARTPRNDARRWPEFNASACLWHRRRAYAALPVNAAAKCTPMLVLCVLQGLANLYGAGLNKTDPVFVGGHSLGGAMVQGGSRCVCGACMCGIRVPQQATARSP